MLIDQKTIGGAVMGMALTIGTIVGASALSQTHETSAGASQIAGSRAPWTDGVARAAVTSPARTTTPAVRRVRQSDVSSPAGRSWKKTVLVIGGSTAAGAGIGGLIGGKKGALVGTAIGAGGSAIYEAVKRR